MDTQLFNTSVSIATAVVTSSTLAHGHPPYVIQAIIDLSFSTYEELKTRIAAVDAAEKAVEEAEFAQHAAERAEAERAEAKLAASEGASEAASDLPGAEERGESV